VAQDSESRLASVDAKSLLPTAWSLFRTHWVTFVGAELAILASWVLLEAAVISLHHLNLAAPMGWAAWLALHLAFLWLLAGLAAGIHAMALQVVDGGLPTMGGAVSRLSDGGSYLLALSVYWVSVVLGLCLLIVPGVFVAVRWALFAQVFASQPSSARMALQRAALLSADQRGPVFRLVLLTAGLNLGGLALLGVGFLVSFPVTVLLSALFFRSISAGRAN
jgi:hypothetical protein